jgi:hypothetical protein
MTYMQAAAENLSDLAWQSPPRFGRERLLPHKIITSTYAKSPIRGTDERALWARVDAELAYDATPIVDLHGAG